MGQSESLPECCEHCGSRDLRRDLVRSALWHRDQLVVVEDIPALVCGECHEQFYDDATVTQLDLLRGQGFPREHARAVLEVPVFSLLPRRTADEEP
jgi:YgiT-type zinc finger domain-containing protein